MQSEALGETRRDRQTSTGWNAPVVSHENMLSSCVAAPTLPVATVGIRTPHKATNQIEFPFIDDWNETGYEQVKDWNETGTSNNRR